MKTQDFVHKEKRLAYLLRHDKNYPLYPNGWREIADLVEHHGFTKQELCEIVVTSSKRRFEFSSDVSKIRAFQGHSVNVDLGLEVTTPPDLLYHGTDRSSVDSILANGICRMERQYVNLSADIATAEKVGSRRGGDAVVLCVDARRMFTDGSGFWLSGNGVWLVENVPPRYIKKIS